jgi:predicted enzyme related to lactoylglutathione lyase
VHAHPQKGITTMSVFSVSYVTIMDDDIWSLSEFYEKLFDLTEVPLKTEIYRGLDMNGVVLSFSSPEAYDLLGLEEPAGPKDVHEFITFTTTERTHVEHYTRKAMSLGAKLAKEPHTTYYGAWLSVLLDPSGNAFRICHADH